MMDDLRGPTCCSIRRKVMVAIVAVLPEEQCGVPDSELADVMRFDLGAPTGKPILGFLFCPWCGKPHQAGDERRVTDLSPRETLDG